MCADDFTFTKHSIDVGFWQTQIYWYYNLTGRFVRNIMLVLFGIISSANGKVYVYTLFSFLILLISFFFFFKNLIRSKTSFIVILILASLSFVTFYLITPIKDESWYWMSGSVTYLWPAIFGIAATAFLIDKSKSVLNFSLAFIFAFLAGANEFSGLIFSAVLFLLIIKSLFESGWVIPKNNNYFNKLCVVTAGVAISFIIMYIAPGNFVRIVGPDSHEMGVFGTIVYSIQEGPKLLFSIFLNNAVYLSAFFATLVLYFSVIKSKNKGEDQNINNLLFNTFFILCVPIILSILYMLPGFRALTRPPPGRADVILAFILLMSLIFASNELSKIFTYLNFDRFVLFKLFGCVFAFILFISGLQFTSTFAWDIYIAKNYSDTFDRMFSQLSLVKGNKDKIIIVEPLPESGLVHSEKLSSDPSNYANGPYSYFFNLKGIATENPTTVSAKIKN